MPGEWRVELADECHALSRAPWLFRLNTLVLFYFRFYTFSTFSCGRVLFVAHVGWMGGSVFFSRSLFCVWMLVPSNVLHDTDVPSLSITRQEEAYFVPKKVPYQAELTLEDTGLAGREAYIRQTCAGRRVLVLIGTSY